MFGIEEIKKLLVEMYEQAEKIQESDYVQDRVELVYEIGDVMGHIDNALDLLGGAEIQDIETDKALLPTKLAIYIHKDLDGDPSEKSIAKFLRKTYGHYLSGFTKKKFDMEHYFNDGCWVAYVNNIKWGRKRYL